MAEDAALPQPAFGAGAQGFDVADNIARIRRSPATSSSPPTSAGGRGGRKSATAISPRGERYTAENIRQALDMRNFARKACAATASKPAARRPSRRPTGGPSPTRSTGCWRNARHPETLPAQFAGEALPTLTVQVARQGRPGKETSGLPAAFLRLPRLRELQLRVLLFDHVQVIFVVRRQMTGSSGAVRRDVGAVAVGKLAQFAGSPLDPARGRTVVRLEDDQHPYSFSSRLPPRRIAACRRRRGSGRCPKSGEKAGSPFFSKLLKTFLQIV